MNTCIFPQPFFVTMYPSSLSLSPEPSLSAPCIRPSGDYEFIMRESDDYRSIELEVTVSKFLDTSLMKIDMQPTYIRLLIKGRLLQLKLPEEVRAVFHMQTAASATAMHSTSLTCPR